MKGIDWFFHPPWRPLPAEPESSEPEFNQFQKVVRETYAGGRMSHVDSLVHQDVGDSLFRFLLKELSDDEECDSLELAVHRLETVIKEVQEVFAVMVAQ